VPKKHLKWGINAIYDNIASFIRVWRGHEQEVQINAIYAGRLRQYGGYFLISAYWAMICYLYAALHMCVYALYTNYC
jgi:hypothetical protein